LLKTREDLDGDQNGPIEIRAAMHHPVTDSRGVDLLLIAQPGGGRMQCRGHIGDVLRTKLAIDSLRAFGAVTAQPRARADAVDLPLYLAGELSVRLRREDLEFDARRARIDDEDGIHQVRRPAAVRRYAAHAPPERQPRRTPCAIARNLPAK
jgi:hypothetical protein